MKTEVTTQSVAEKIKTRVLPAVFIIAGLAFVGAGAFLFFKTLKQPTRQQPSVFQSLEKDKYVPGQVLVKFKTVTNSQEAVVAEVFEQPQQVYYEKKTGKTVEQLTEAVKSDTKNYSIKTVTLSQKSMTPLFTANSISPSVAATMKKRGVKEPHAQIGAFGLDRWQLITLNDDASINDLVFRFRANSQVEWSEPNYLVSVSQETSPDPNVIDDPGGGGGGTQLTIPNDPYYLSSGAWGNTYRDQWGPERIGVANAWAKTTGSVNVVVAVSDTGIDYNHPDIQSQIWRNANEGPGDTNGDGCPGSCGFDDDGDGLTDEGAVADDDENGFADDTRGYDFTRCNQFDFFTGVCITPKAIDNDPQDDHGHGTHVAGTIGAATNNDLGIVGLNWNVRLMPVKGLNYQGAGTIADLADTISYATNSGADVINMSWGGSVLNQALSDVLDYAYSQGVIAVAAAGNDNRDVNSWPPTAPANHPRVMAVAAWCPNNTTLPGYCENPTAFGSRALFSNFGNKIDVTAPGADILSLRAANTDMYADGTHIVPTCSETTAPRCPTNQYYRANGTSMAAPHVSGTIALLRALYPALSPDLARLVVQRSAEDVDAGGRDDYTGHGLLQAGQAVNLMQTLMLNPRPELIVPASSARPHGLGQGRVEATIANIGLAPALNVRYQVIAGDPSQGQVIGNGTIASLEVNQQQTITVDYSVAAITASQFTTRVSFDQANTEPYTDNNESVSQPSLIMAGWPRQLGAADGSSAPAIGDLDGDGTKEVVIGSGPAENAVYAWHQDGTPVSGWPIITNGPVSSSPTLADLDGNGKLEVVIGGTNYMYVWRQSTNPAIWENYPGWPKTFTGLTSPLIGNVPSPVVADIDGGGLDIVMPDANGNIYIWHANGALLSPWPKPGASVTARDLTGDGRPEIISATGGVNGKVSVKQWDGTDLPGWPKTVGDVVKSTPAIGDINNDGSLEIVAVTADGKIHVWKRTDSITWDYYPGWPRKVGPGRIFYTSPIIANVDSNGDSEIVVGYLDGAQVFVLKSDGTNYSSAWPKNIDRSFGIVASPAVADVDGDDMLEIVVGALHDDGKVYGWHADGNPLIGWPVPTEKIYPYEAYVNVSSAIADLDNDNAPEIIGVGGTDAKVYVWKVMEAAVGAVAPWPTDHHDTQRTGDYSFVTPAPPAISDISVSFSGMNAIVSWTTDIDTDGIVNWGLTSAYGSHQSDFSFTRSHTISISAPPGQTYHYAIRGCARNGLCATTPDATFTR